MQTRIALLAPIGIIPFLTLLAWAMGVGKAPIKKDQTSQTHIPPPAAPAPSLFNKLDFYTQAAKDSAQYETTTGSPPPLPIPRPVRDTVETRIATSVARLQAVLAAPPPAVQNAPSPLPLAPSRPQPPPVPPDPEVSRLENMLNKILAIQHPQTLRLPDTVDAVPIRDDALEATPAVSETDGVLTTGEVMALRLQGNLKVRGWNVPEGTCLYGVVSLDNERLRVHIRTILVGTRILGVNLEAYDLDGQPGIYVPGSLDRDVSKASADAALGSIGVATLDPSFGAQAAGAGVQALKSLISRKVRLTRVTVREGYHLLIR